MQSQNNNPVSVTAVPFNPQTQSFTPTPIQPAINPAITTTSKIVSGTGEIINPTPQDIAAYNAKFTTVPTVQPSPVITADTIGTQKIPVPTTLPSVQNETPTNLASQIIADTANKETEAQKLEKSLSRSIFDIAPLLAGQSQMQSEQEKLYGKEVKMADLNNINSQIKIKEAELRQDDVKLAQSIQNIEDKPIAMEFITGQQQSVARNAQIARAFKNSEIDVLNARAVALQGDIALATDMATKAVKAKYDPIRETLSIIQMQQEALKPELNADEKKQLREQEIKTKLAFNDIKKREENETKANEMVINAMPFAPKSITEAAQKVISQGGSIVQVAQALGKYAGDFLGNQLKLSSIAENNMQIAKIAADIKATQATIPNNAPAGSTNYSITSWTNSAKNKNSLTAEERSGVSKAFSVVNQIGALQENLKKDQTSFFGGNVKKIMASIGQNADAGTIQAQITGLVPQVAKGIYGEVGVLTDQDTARYTQTLPNLTSPEKQNDAVTALTLTALRNGVKSKLDVAAASNLDVSGFVPLYQDLTTKINVINDRTGVNDVKIGEIVKANPQAKPLVEAMIKEGKKGSEILQVLGAE